MREESKTVRTLFQLMVQPASCCIKKKINSAILMKLNQCLQNWILQQIKLRTQENNQGLKCPYNVL